MRDILITDPPGAFGFEDITGLPWTEIDFKEDINYANNEILDQLADHRPCRPELVVVGD